MIQQMNINQLAYHGAYAILSAFNAYHIEFMKITRRAKSRFENQEWQNMQKDVVERLELYKIFVDRVVGEIASIFGFNMKNKLLWNRMKEEYSSLIVDRYDHELAETFFNSVTRRIFATVGVEPNIEYVDSDFRTLPRVSGKLIHKIYSSNESTKDLIKGILMYYQFKIEYQNIERDATLVADEIITFLQTIWGVQ
jgi:isocitrate dehydrogenase kinase/phosphatase